MGKKKTLKTRKKMSKKTKETWSKFSPEKRKEISEKMSASQKKRWAKYSEQKKLEISRNVSKGQTERLERYAKEKPEKYKRMLVRRGKKIRAGKKGFANTPKGKAFAKKMSKINKAICSDPEVVRKRVLNMQKGKRPLSRKKMVTVVEENVRRINDYCGVVTLSEMETL